MTQQCRRSSLWPILPGIFLIALMAMGISGRAFGQGDPTTASLRGLITDPFRRSHQPSDDHPQQLREGHHQDNASGQGRWLFVRAASAVHIHPHRRGEGLQRV
jgi:hypothetical protein